MIKQIADVEDMLSQGINVLILNARDPKGLVPATKACTAAKVPVVEMDSSIDPSADYVTIVQSSNSANGQLVGDYLVNVMGTCRDKQEEGTRRNRRCLKVIGDHGFRPQGAFGTCKPA